MRTLVLLTIILFSIGCKGGREARELMKQHRAEAVPMIGMLTFMADAASFIDCKTGERFTVKFKGDWLEVERSYVTMHGDGKPMYVEFFGRAENDTTDGNIRPGMVIEEITEMRPDTTCPLASGAQ
jgi:hypothetical protein